MGKSYFLSIGRPVLLGLGMISAYHAFDKDQIAEAHLRNCRTEACSLEVRLERVESTNLGIMTAIYLSSSLIAYSMTRKKEE